MTGPTCQDCGQPATNYVADINLIGSEKDMDGKLWAVHEVRSRHYFCAAHVRESRRYFPDGHSELSMPPEFASRYLAWLASVEKAP